MTSAMAGEFWKLINEYVKSCRGRPDKYVYGNTHRQETVAAIEKLICEIEKRAVNAALDQALNSGDGVYRP